VLGDKKTLLPDPVATVEATEKLVAEGFQVLCYTTDDPVTARRLKAAGAVSVMPAGSPIGSGQGILNPSAIRICLEYLKEGDPDYPVIVDAGVGTASDVTKALELGVDGVLLNTAVAHARDPVGMARAMAAAVQAGRLAYLSGRIPRRLYATASSPLEGVVE
jgi:thiazole synthase